MSPGPSNPPQTGDALAPATSSWRDVVSRGVAEETAMVLARFGVGPNAMVPATVARACTDASGADRSAFTELGRIMAACVVRTNCEHFGLLVGQGDLLAALGLAGSLIPGSQTLGDVLANLVGRLGRHADANAPTLSVELVVEGADARLGYAMPRPSAEGADQVADVALALTLN